jgi:hypothetical protein
LAAENLADDALAGTIADGLERLGVLAVERTDQQFAALLVEQRHQTMTQTRALVQHAEHLAQGLAQVKRTAQHAADLEQGRELGFEQGEPARLPGRARGGRLEAHGSIRQVQSSESTAFRDSRIRQPPVKSGSTSIDPPWALTIS